MAGCKLRLAQEFSIAADFCHISTKPWPTVSWCNFLLTDLSSRCLIRHISLMFGAVAHRWRLQRALRDQTALQILIWQSLALLTGAARLMQRASSQLSFPPSKPMLQVSLPCIPSKFCWLNCIQRLAQNEDVLIVFRSHAHYVLDSVCSTLPKLSCQVYTSVLQDVSGSVVYLHLLRFAAPITSKLHTACYYNGICMMAFLCTMPQIDCKHQYSVIGGMIHCCVTNVANVCICHTELKQFTAVLTWVLQHSQGAKASLMQSYLGWLLATAAASYIASCIFPNAHPQADNANMHRQFMLQLHKSTQGDEADLMMQKHAQLCFSVSSNTRWVSGFQNCAWSGAGVVAAALRDRTFKRGNVASIPVAAGLRSDKPTPHVDAYGGSLKWSQQGAQ